MSEPITEKQFTVSAKELIYIISLVVALLGQWFSQKAALNEQVIQLRADDAILRLELLNLKARLEKIEK